MALDQRGALEGRKELIVFVLSAALLAAYAALWLVRMDADGGAGRNSPAEQRFVVGSAGEAPLPDAGAVFASAAADAYHDAAIPPRWVTPKARPVAKKPVKLELPMPTFPAPPMLLPVPGPAVEYTGDLPRWPAFPPAQPAGR